MANGNGLDNVAVVSPYRVNTSYRRPAYGDSDHGYSTMTPNNDAHSEHTASYIEPLLLVGRQRPSALRSSAAAAGASVSDALPRPLISFRVTLSGVYVYIRL